MIKTSASLRTLFQFLYEFSILCRRSSSSVDLMEALSASQMGSK
jgi:hypothetical protein